MDAYYKNILMKCDGIHTPIYVIHNRINRKNKYFRHLPLFEYLCLLLVIRHKLHHSLLTALITEFICAQDAPVNHIYGLL